jgi:two-component system, NtrC family, nitrogen regulation response regulator NtrX
MAKVLIVDDEEYVREAIRDIMEMQNHRVEEASSGNQAVSLVSRAKYDAVFLDIKMANGDGMETLPRLLTAEPELPVIMISGHGTIETAVEAMRIGAFDYLEKPLDNNRILATLRNALDKKELTSINRKLNQRSSAQSKPSRVEIIGESKPLQDIMQQVERSAPYDATVLITGENGTGKELLAKKIHEMSNRSKEIFLAVNCSAMVDTLLETTLFGSKKGAYTDSKEDRVGLFEEARGGTLFLDEIGDMSESAQAKILRALQEKVITRVGDNKTLIPVDVRVVAATNKNLEQMVDEGKFRLDLLMRLKVIPLRLPSLNERRDDIPLLISFFNNRIAEQYSMPVPKEFTDQAIKALVKYNWRGNIRELCNIVERLNILCDQQIGLQDINNFVYNGTLDVNQF